LKRVPKRLCIGCGERKEQADLLRIVHTDSELFVNDGKRMDGRGAWICRNPECAGKMIRRKGLDRSFHTHFSDSAYSRIREEMIPFYG